MIKLLKLAFVQHGRSSGWYCSTQRQHHLGTLQEVTKVVCRYIQYIWQGCTQAQMQMRCYRCSDCIIFVSKSHISFDNCSAERRCSYQTLKTLQNTLKIFFWQTGVTSWGWAVPSSVKLEFTDEVVVKVSSWSYNLSWSSNTIFRVVGGWIKLN